MIEEFRIEIPVEVKKVPYSEGSAILLPNKKKAIIEYSHDDDLFDLVATLRLGLDYSPLLTTFYFQEKYTEKEAEYMKKFHLLCLPITKTWAFLNALKYVEEEKVKKEAKEIAEYVNLTYMWVSPESYGEQFLKQIHHVTAYLLLKYVVKMDTILKVEGEHVEEWKRYIELAEELVKEKPSPYLLAKIPEKTSAPYRVRVRKQPFSHYEVKGS